MVCPDESIVDGNSEICVDGCDSDIQSVSSVGESVFSWSELHVCAITFKLHAI